MENESTNPINPVNQPAASQQQPVPPIQQPGQPLSPEPEKHNTNTKTIVTVLALLFAYPIGLLLMWFWAKWPKWVKFLITLPLLLAIVGIILAFSVATKDPFKTLEKAQDANYINTANEFSSALQNYYNLHQTLPWTANPPCANKPTGNENIAALAPCVDLLIKDDILKSGFMTATTYINNLYVSDNSTAENVNISTCFLPSVQTSADKYTKNGQICNSTSCYHCSFSQFPQTAVSQ